MGDIYDFLDAAAGDEIAVATVERLRAECRHLAELSGTLGRPRPELRADLRGFPFRGYVIFFRYEGETLLVLNVLNARRDIEGGFDDD